MAAVGHAGVGEGEPALGRESGDARRPTGRNRAGRILEGVVGARCGARCPSSVAVGAAGIPLPKAAGSFIGFSQKKTAALFGRTRTLKFLAADELKQIVWTMSMQN